MRDADKMIERLLAGLQDAEPSAGLQGRVLKAMDAHESMALGARYRRLVSPWLLRLSTMIPVACAVIFAVLLTVRYHRHATDPQQATRPKVIAQKAPQVPYLPPSRVAVRHQHRKVAPAMREAQTASYPAPPLPLTEQEKLLLRLAHRGDPENVATLNRNVQAAQSAKATEQFQDFFGIDAKEMRNKIE
jgi:hypothetical protein